MDSFDIDKLFERAAGEVRPPQMAPCESRRCRAFHLPHMAAMKWQRCNFTAEQHDGTCWAHADYYRGWWRRHVPTNDYEEDRLMYDQLEEMTFQLERGYVSLKDDELRLALRQNSRRDLFFSFLCSYADFDPYEHPVAIQYAVARAFNHIINNTKSYAEAYAELHRAIDRDWIFDCYLQCVVHWIKDNIQGILGPATMLDAMLRLADVSYAHVAGQRYDLADHIADLRNPHIKDEREDDRYTTCKGRFWAWILDLKSAARAAYEPLRAELLAATWAPIRLPFWCLDVEEVAEEHPEGLPTKAAWTALCSAVAV